MGKKIDMTGWIMKEHGVENSRLTVLYELPKRRNKEIIWHCRCECGNECDVMGDRIRRGLTLSCGCLRKEIAKRLSEIRQPAEDLTNQKFGKLTVLGLADKKSDRKRYWKCQCDCGNICIVRGDILKEEKTKSCGCLKLSYGELKILELLEKNNINFEQEKSFDNCKFINTNKLAKFDFYVNNQYIIEYDGKQHFQSENTGWNNEEHFIMTQKHDQFKNQYCFEHNIPIIRIPYTHLKDICLEDLIPETSQFLLKKKE